jgi:hypothetical protein
VPDGVAGLFKKPAELYRYTTKIHLSLDLRLRASGRGR